MELLIVSAVEFASRAAERIAGELLALSRRPGPISLALSGGQTPAATYLMLAGDADVPWPAIDLFMVDERAVPPDHVDSNFRMITENLLDHLASSPHAIHRMRADREDLDGAAEEYARVLPSRVDLMILGIGSDCHTASLFPGHFTPDDRSSVLPINGPRPPVRRLTLGPNIIRDANRRIVLATGAGKSTAVHLALEGPVDPARCPAQLARDSLWILDPAAASQLRTAR